MSNRQICRNFAPENFIRVLFYCTRLRTKNLKSYIQYESNFYTTYQLLHRQTVRQVGVLFSAQQKRQSVRAALSSPIIRETESVEQTVCTTVCRQAPPTQQSITTGSAPTDATQKANAGYPTRQTDRTTIPRAQRYTSRYTYCSPPYHCYPNHSYHRTHHHANGYYATTRNATTRPYRQHRQHRHYRCYIVHLYIYQPQIFTSMIYIHAPPLRDFPYKLQRHIPTVAKQTIIFKTLKFYYYGKI